MIIEFCEGSWDARCDDCGDGVGDFPSERDAEDFLEAHMAIAHGVVALELGGEAVTVGMLDHATETLHRPGDVHLMTACGAHLHAVTFAPMSVFDARPVPRCPECLPERSKT